MKAHRFLVVLVLLTMLPAILFANGAKETPVAATPAVVKAAVAVVAEPTREELIKLARPKGR